MSQRFVGKRLNLLGAARFQDAYSAKIEDLGDGVYSVISYVDTQDSSGVTSRVRYFCKLKQAAGGWQLIELTTSPSLP